MLNTLSRFAGHSLIPLVFVGALGLAGCSSQNEAAEPVETEVQSVATEVVTDAPTEGETVPPVEELYPYPKPELPEAAKQHTQEGAEAFALYFWEVLPYSQGARDESILVDICGPQAEFCLEQIELIKLSKEVGAYFVGSKSRDLEPLIVIEGGRYPHVEWSVRLLGTLEAYSTHRIGSEETTEYPERRFWSHVEVYWDDGWKVSEFLSRPYDPELDG